MITLVLAFPRGRYAATPWGEPRGAVELPPSPWRLLRALYATWRSRRPDLDEATVHGLLCRLAEPPAFDVPRHGVRGGVALFERDAELAVHWSVALTSAQHEALAQLASAIPYLGRADSRCSGRLEPGWRPAATTAGPRSTSRTRCRRASSRRHCWRRPTRCRSTPCSPPRPGSAGEACRCRPARGYSATRETRAPWSRRP